MSLVKSDTLNSCDVQDRYDELVDQCAEGRLTLDEWAELGILSRFLNVANKTVDDAEWRSGITLINENYFVDYIKSEYPDWNHEMWDTLPDIIKKNLDWEGIAEQFRSDYTSLEFDGVTFYYI